MNSERKIPESSVKNTSQLEFILLMAVPIAAFIGSFVQTTALPLFMGFGACGLGSVLLLMLTKNTEN